MTAGRGAAGRGAAGSDPVAIDLMDIGTAPGRFAADAAAVEHAGVDGAWTSETRHDPMIGLALAAAGTSTLRLGSGVSIALARTPMTTAASANDLQLASGGRFVLGLGTQVRAHVTRRFSMPWSRPVDRMREYVAAIRAIWTAWDTGERLDFRGDFTTHTIMTPFFSPGPNPWGHPPIHLSGVGPAMTEVAGEVADGFLTHPFATERYLREVTLPALARGRARAGREDEPFEVCVAIMVATGDTEDELAAARRAVRAQIAMYGSVPAYGGVLERHGWDDLGAELRGGASPDAVDEEVLRTVAVVAEPDRLGVALRERAADLADRILVDAPGGGAARWAGRAATGSRSAAVTSPP